MKVKEGDRRKRVFPTLRKSKPSRTLQDRAEPRLETELSFAKTHLCKFLVAVPVLSPQDHSQPCLGLTSPCHCPRTMVPCCGRPLNKAIGNSSNEHSNSHHNYAPMAVLILIFLSIAFSLSDNLSNVTSLLTQQCPNLNFSSYKSHSPQHRASHNFTRSQKHEVGAIGPSKLTASRWEAAKPQSLAPKDLMGFSNGRFWDFKIGGNPCRTLDQLLSDGKEEERG